MLVTEEEAKTKICQGCQDTLCQASDCMAWRWFDAPIMGGPVDDPQEWGRDVVAKDQSTRRGYCGLAGKPEEV